MALSFTIQYRAQRDAFSLKYDISETRRQTVNGKLKEEVTVYFSIHDIQ
jgi:hypothetical protein